MAVSASFLDALRDVLDFVTDLRIKRMFGGAGIYAGDLIFALAVNEALYLKSDAISKSDFEAQGLEPFVVRDRPTRATCARRTRSGKTGMRRANGSTGRRRRRGARAERPHTA